MEGSPKQYTPEEIAKMEKSRTISDTQLLEGGAEYSVNKNGEKDNLLVTENIKDAEAYQEDIRKEKLENSIAPNLFLEKIGKDLERRLEAGDLAWCMMRMPGFNDSGDMDESNTKYLKSKGYIYNLNEEQAEFVVKTYNAAKEIGLNKKQLDTIFFSKRNFLDFLSNGDEDTFNHIQFLLNDDKSVGESFGRWEKNE